MEVGSKHTNKSSAASVSYVVRGLLCFFLKSINNYLKRYAEFKFK